MPYTNINKSSDHFNTKLYTGTGSTQSISSVGFQPDWVWIKRRDGTNTHNLFDAVRGATKALEINEGLAEQTLSTSLTSFDSDGFTLGSGGDVNSSSASQVSWNWKANGSGSANTDGSINSTVSANTTSGFSIVKYTGSGSGEVSIGHGLGATPKVVLIKNLGASADWLYYTTVIDGTLDILRTNDTSTKTDSSATLPTNQLFYGISISNQSNDYIAYCFAEKKGFSKFGSYEGNGNTDGLFIYTGFKPAFVMIKSYNTASRFWTIQDNKRSSSGGPNPNDKWLYANTNDAEVDQASNPMDFLSNGFKLRNNGAYQNSNAYIYMAFAEAPLVGSNNVPCTAR